jgi:hypothetical protein
VQRLAGIAVVAVMVTALSAGTAFAQSGAPNFGVEDSPEKVEGKGPGFKVEMTKDGIETKIDDAEFGIPSAGFPIVRRSSVLGGPNLRPFVCDNGTYRLPSGSFEVVQRTSNTDPRPLPYTPQFNQRYGGSFTFVGTMDAPVTDESGEQFRLLLTDLVHEVMTPTSFSSTAPVHAFIVDEQGRVVDRAAMIGLVNIDRQTGEAEHKIIDTGTCHQTFNLDLGPGTDQATIFGPFFVLPFNTTVVMPDPDDD